MDIRMTRLEWLSAELSKEINRIETSYNIKEMMNNKQTTDMTWDEYGNPIPPTGGGDNMNNNPGNMDNTMNMTVLRNHIVMYLDNIESHGTKKELMDATDVLFDFLQYTDNNKQS